MIAKKSRNAIKDIDVITGKGDFMSDIEQRISKYAERHITFRKSSNKHWIASLNCDKLIDKIEKVNRAINNLSKELSC